MALAGGIGRAAGLIGESGGVVGYRDLRDFLAKLEKEGELARASARFFCNANLQLALRWPDSRW